MALSPVTELLTDADVITQLGDTTDIAPDTITHAVEATKSYVARYHSTPMTTDDPSTVAWPYDYKLGAVKLAAGLVRGGLSSAIANGDADDMFTTAKLERLTDLAIEQLLQIGRFAIPKVG